MSSKIQRSPFSNSQENQRHSLFFRDLASPISTSHRTRRFATSDTPPPPPPVFTLEDRVGFSPEPAPVPDFPTSPGSGPAPDTRTPTPSRNYITAAAAAANTPSPNKSSGSWWAPQRIEEEEKEKGSPVDGVVTSSSRALVVLPPLKEVAKAETGREMAAARDGSHHGMALDEEEWVTVYGFSSGDTNLVLREFEKCGVILKHIPGPREANWMHILYQNRYDAQKALAKNGIQLNSALIVGVKPVDSVQRQYLNQKLSNTHGGFTPSLPPQFIPGRSGAVAPRPNYQQNGRTVGRDGSRPHSNGAIASPEKSVLSKVMDLMFGL